MIHSVKPAAQIKREGKMLKI